jgi:hypothetical protein
VLWVSSVPVIGVSWSTGFVAFLLDLREEPERPEAAGCESVICRQHD